MTHLAAARVSSDARRLFTPALWSHTFDVDRYPHREQDTKRRSNLSFFLGFLRSQSLNLTDIRRHGRHQARRDAHRHGNRVCAAEEAASGTHKPATRYRVRFLLTLLISVQTETRNAVPVLKPNWICRAWRSSETSLPESRVL